MKCCYYSYCSYKGGVKLELHLYCLNKMWLLYIRKKRENWNIISNLGGRSLLFIHLDQSLTSSAGLVKTFQVLHLIRFFFFHTRKKIPTIRQRFVFVPSTETNLSSSPCKLSAGIWEQATGDSQWLILSPVPEWGSIGLNVLNSAISRLWQIGHRLRNAISPFPQYGWRSHLEISPIFTWLHHEASCEA